MKQTKYYSETYLNDLCVASVPFDDLHDAIRHAHAVNLDNAADGEDRVGVINPYVEKPIYLRRSGENK